MELAVRLEVYAQVLLNIIREGLAEAGGEEKIPEDSNFRDPQSLMTQYYSQN